MPVEQPSIRPVHRVSRRTLLLGGAAAVGLWLVDGCGESGPANEFANHFQSQFQVGNKMQILDATALFTQVRRRSYPEVLTPYEWYQPEGLLQRNNIVYTTNPEQVEVVEKPFYSKVKDVHWLIYPPPNDQARFVCVAITTDVDNLMRISTDHKPGILRYIEGGEKKIKEVKISELSREIMSTFQRPVVFYEESGENKRIARATILEYSPWYDFTK